MIAQPNTLYFMDNIHQSNYLNPAFQGNCNGYLSLPAMSGVFANASNSGFDYNDLIHLGTGLLSDSLVIDIEKVKTKLGKKNYLNAELFVPILGFGFWSGDSYITFEISNKTKLNFSYPESFIALTGGNVNNIGIDNPLAIEKFGPDVINYNEFAFGWSKKIVHRLTIGAKLKILSGLAAVQNKTTDFKLYTADTSYAMQLETDLKYNISAPVDFTYDESGLISDLKYDEANLVSDLMPTKNFGLALDLGAVYQFNDHLKLFASLTDLGFIRWNNKPVELSQKGSFNFTGLSLDSVWSDSDYDEMAALGDSISDFFHFEHIDKKFTTMLNANLYLGATYEIAPFLNFGILSRTLYFDKSLHQAFTISANFNPARFFTATLSYSAMNREYKNIGLGFGLKFGPMQFYLLTDNIYTALMPKNSKTFCIMTGINMNFGCGRRDNYSMLNNKKSEKEIDFM